MSADPIEARAPLGALFPATVTALSPGRLGVRGEAFGAASVRCAVPGYRARVGDAVLVGAGPAGERYVVGVLRALREAEASVADASGTSMLDASLATAHVAAAAAAVARVADASVADAPVPDASVAEAHVADAAAADARVADASAEAARVADAQVADAQVAGAQVAGAQVADAQVADAQVADAQVADASVATDDGASARVERDEDGEVLRVRDARGRLVFEHREGRSVVYAPEGDLELATGGRLSLTAARGVHVDAGDAFEARARGPVTLRSGDGDRASEVALDGPDARLEAGSLRAIAERLGAELKEANVVVGTLRTVAHRVRERAETVERTAGRIVETAREVYRDVEELSQTRAGRLRLVAETAFYAIGGETVIKAREDVKITAGDKIYLA